MATPPADLHFSRFNFYFISLCAGFFLNKFSSSIVLLPLECLATITQWSRTEGLGFFDASTAITVNRHEICGP